MKETINVQKISIDKTNLSSGIIVAGEFNENEQSQKQYAAYKILNGAYKDYILINEIPYQDVDKCYFISPNPIGFFNGFNFIHGYIEVGHPLFNKAIGGYLYVNAFDASISYEYLSNLFSMFIKSNLENIEKGEPLNALQDYLETGVSNFPKAATENRGYIYGFLPLQFAATRLAKNLVYEILTKNNMTDNSVIKRYQKELKEQVRELYNPDLDKEQNDELI